MIYTKPRKRAWLFLRLKNTHENKATQPALYKSELDLHRDIKKYDEEYILTLLKEFHHLKWSEDYKSGTTIKVGNQKVDLQFRLEEVVACGQIEHPATIKQFVLKYRQEEIYTYIDKIDVS